LFAYLVHIFLILHILVYWK